MTTLTRTMLAIPLLSRLALGAAGGLDPSFGSGGKVVTGFGHNARALDATLQSDGKLVVVLTLDNTPIATSAFAVARYLSNGTLDASFGRNGLTKIAFTNFINTPNSVAIQPDGKIVAGGEAQSADGSVDEFAMARFNANGTLDTSFGTGGKVTTDFLTTHAGGFHEGANVVLLQPDGKILLGGVVSSNPDAPTDTALARYNSNGSLDTTFGNGGKVSMISIGAVNALAVLTDGQILALNNAAGIAQFQSNGTLVPVTSGTIAVTSHTSITGFQLDAKFILAGGGLGPSGENDLDVKLSRFLPTGGMDPSFFNSPIFDFGAPGAFTNTAQAFAVGSNGRIAVGGLSQTPSFGDIFGLARLNSDGTLDSTFGTGGTVTTNFGGSDQVLAVVVQPDGKIIAVGQTFNTTKSIANLALARYLQ